MPIILMLFVAVCSLAQASLPGASAKSEFGDFEVTQVAFGRVADSQVGWKCHFRGRVTSFASRELHDLRFRITIRGENDSVTLESKSMVLPPNGSSDLRIDCPPTKAPFIAKSVSAIVLGGSPIVTREELEEQARTKLREIEQEKVAFERQREALRKRCKETRTAISKKALLSLTVEEADMRDDCRAAGLW